MILIFPYLGGRDITEEEKSQILYLKTKPGRFWEWEGAGVNMKSDRQDNPINSRLFILNVEILLRLIADQHQYSVSGQNLDINI